MPGRGNDIQLAFAKIHLYDGALYDNLGIEPLFDISKQRTRPTGAKLIVSDAGAPFQSEAARGVLNPFRIMRWLDVTTSQQRDLRVRCLVEALAEHKIKGAYLQIGTYAVERLRKYAPAQLATEEDWLAPTT